MKKASEKTRSKIVRKIGAVLATVALTAGVVVGGVGIAKEQARIDKYVDDKDGSQLATVLMEDLNENLQEQGVDYQFENPQYRAMIAHKKNIATDNESEKKPIEVFIVAQKDNQPYMIKASIDNEDKKVSEKSDALLGTYNPHIVKYNIIENIDNLEVTYDVAPTTMETLKMLDEMGQYSSPLNNPERSHHHLKKSVIAGYAVEKNDDGTLKVTVTSNLSAVYLDEGILSSEQSEDFNKEVSFTIDSAENIEEKIFDYLLKINLHKDDLEVRYSRAGIANYVQGNAKPYELKQPAQNQQEVAVPEQGVEMQ